VKVKWSESADDSVTWEDYQALKQLFLQALAWGQARIQGRGNVSTMQHECYDQQPSEGPRCSCQPK
jgi:hypothetical protein